MWKAGLRLQRGHPVLVLPIHPPPLEPKTYTDPSYVQGTVQEVKFIMASFGSFWRKASKIMLPCLSVPNLVSFFVFCFFVTEV